MTAATDLPTRHGALDRIRDAADTGALRRYDGSWADGDPFNVPAEGRVHLGDDGSIGIDLPDDGPDGIAYHDLGDAGASVVRYACRDCGDEWVGLDSDVGSADVAPIDGIVLCDTHARERGLA